MFFESIQTVNLGQFAATKDMYRVTHKDWDFRDDCRESNLYVSIYSFLFYIIIKRNFEETLFKTLDLI